MKDLKHLIYFENLLEDANNELVRQAQADGSIVLGYTCYHIPEVLLNVDNCISVRLRAPKTGSLDISTYYMSNYTCDYARALVERAIEGGYQFLDALIGVDACSAMNRSMEHFEVLKVNSKEKFFVTHTDMPLKVTDYYIDAYTTQMREHVLNRLTETFGVDTSDEALRKAVAEHNDVCEIISEIAEMRKLDNPIITGYEFHILNLVSYACPKALILPYLRETLAELKKRKPDAKSPYRARVAIVGSEIDAHRGLRRADRVRPFLLRQHAGPRGHQAQRRGRRPASDLPPLHADQRVRSLHLRREGAPAPRDG